MEKINELIHLDEKDKIYYQTTLEELQNLQQLKKNIKNETNAVFLFYQMENECYQKVVSQINNDITTTMKKLKKFDQENILYGVLSDTLLILPGSILDGGDISVSIPNTGGNISYFNPLYTYTYKISNIITTMTTSTPSK